MIPYDDATPPSGSLYPQSYAIEMTKEYTKTFCEEPLAPPPDAVRNTIWEEVDGEAIRKELQSQADAEYELAMAQYNAEVPLIESHNQKCAAEHEENLRRFEGDFDKYCDRTSSKRANRLHGLLLNRLFRSLNAQEGRIAAIIAAASRKARRAPLFLLLCFFWLLSIPSYFVVGIMFFPLGMVVAGLVSCCLWIGTINSYVSSRRRLLERMCDPCDARQDQSVFWLHYERPSRRKPNNIYTPIYVLEGVEGCVTKIPEPTPLRIFDADDEWINSDDKERLVYLSCIPGIYLLALAKCLWHLKKCVLDDSQAVERVLNARKDRLISAFQSEVTSYKVRRLLKDRYRQPECPGYPAIKSIPSPPVRTVVPLPEFPAKYKLQRDAKDYSHVVRGTTVKSIDEVREMARHAMFADGHVRPFHLFGGVPVLFTKGQVHHTALIGGAGSGKTVLMRSLMITLLPLTRVEVRRILRQRSGVVWTKPASHQEWSRSFTHQSVVYNAKNAQIPFLESLGFVPGEDLIIFDPCDSRMSAWDVAKDNDDYDSIKQFAEQYIPFPTESKRDGNAEFWLAQARDLIEATIIAFRNAAHAAGKKPSWTLRDLINAFDTPDHLRELLRQHHDKPEAMLAQFFDVAPGQKDSTFITAGQYVRRFDVVASRWDKAIKEGRCISLKEWALNGAHSVLVLPNTKSNIKVNEPLNQMFLKALTNICLDPKYSLFTKEAGECCVRKRTFFVDEIGQAGRLADFERLMTEGREFAVQVVFGLHQLSQMRETYGEHGAETLIGLCSYLAFLKTGDTTTAEWMSKRVGDQLRTYDQVRFSYGTSKGESWTETQSVTGGWSAGINASETNGQAESFGTSTGTSSNSSRSIRSGNSTGHSTQQTQSLQHSESHSGTWGISEQASGSETTGTSKGHNSSSNESKSYSKEFRQEAALLPAYFLNLPDPASSGLIGGVFIVPSFPVWEAELSLAMLLDRLPQGLHERPSLVGWGEADDNVSRPTTWNSNDFQRLNIDSENAPKRLEHLTEVQEPKTHRGAKLSSDFDF